MSVRFGSKRTPAGTFAPSPPMEYKAKRATTPRGDTPILRTVACTIGRSPTRHFSIRAGIGVYVYVGSCNSFFCMYFIR